jgi:hypothetical protein
MACWLPGEDFGLSSTLLTRIGEPVTNEAGFTAIDDAALIIEDEAVACTGPASTAPPAWPAASQPPRTGGSALPSSGDTSAKTSKIFGRETAPDTNHNAELTIVATVSVIQSGA